jgi:hypothetical protein
MQGRASLQSGLVKPLLPGPLEELAHLVLFDRDPTVQLGGRDDAERDGAVEFLP